MPTMLKLDDDVALALRSGAHDRGVPLQRFANQVLREQLRADPRGRRPYAVPRLALRSRPGTDLRKALSLADAIDDQARLKTSG